MPLYSILDDSLLKFTPWETRHMQACIIAVRAGDDIGTFWVLKPDAADWLRYPILTLQPSLTPSLQLLGGMDRDTVVVIDLNPGRSVFLQPGQSVETALATAACGAAAEGSNAPTKRRELARFWC